MRVRDAADDLFAPEDVLCDLCSHQVHGVILAHGGHSVAVLHAALLEDVGVGGVAHKGRAAKGIIIKAVQPLELLGVLFDQGNIMADAFQIPHQCRAHLVAADHQNIHGCHLIVQNLLLSGPAVRVRRKHREKRCVQYSIFPAADKYRKSRQCSCIKFVIFRAQALRI